MSDTLRDLAPTELPLLDVRPEGLFRAAHHPEAANVPLEELGGRQHELPPRGRTIRVTDALPARVEAAVAALRERDHDATPAEPYAGPLAAGPATVRLWDPLPWLSWSVDRIVAAAPGGRALDLACGSGRDAVFLAMVGMKVTAVDVLPDALARARDLAGRCGVEIETAECDLERHEDRPPEPLARPDAWDLIVVASYLHRPLFPAIRRAVRPGGMVVYETFLDEQAKLFGKPKNRDHLLGKNELWRLFEGWEMLTYREGLASPRRFVASAFARKPIDALV